VTALGLALGLIALAGCGGEDKSGGEKGDRLQTDRVEKKIREEVAEKMRQAEQQAGELDAYAAHELARPEADTWDPAARLYRIEGEKNLQPDGTAMMWTAYYAIQEDPENAPSRDQGKKLVVLMMQGRIMKAEKKETQQEIAWTTECHRFLPENWMNSDQAYSKCFAALKEKHGAEMEKAGKFRIDCVARNYRQGSDWVRTPAWELSCSIDGSPAAAQIHAVTGEVLEVK
jgi:hypothetical protein